MNIPGRRRPPARLGRSGQRLALTAAAQSGNPDQNRPAQKLRRLHQDWQVRALATYDTVGECWYPSQFYARSLAKTRWFPAMLNAKGEPEEVADGPLVELFDRIRDPGTAGRSDLAAAYGRLQFLNGDGYLTVTQDDDGEAWEYLSVLELKIDPNERADQPQRYRRLRAPGAKPEELAEAPDSDFEPLKGNNIRVWRLWRPHPTYSQLGDAPVRAVLDLYELLHRLTLAAAGEASSRAAQRGALVVANEISEAYKQRTENPDDDPESDPFLNALVEALTNGISNPGTAEALSPLLIRGPAAIQTPGGVVSLKDMVFWMALGPSGAYTEGDMWDKTIQRIGNGLDLPREYITGVEKANHWTGWLIDEQGYRQHVAPVSERFCNDLASAYLRPAAKLENIADWERVVVGYDPADAILHPDKVQTAFDAHDRLIVSDGYVLEAIGATTEDVPSDEELERRIMVLLKQDPYATEGDEQEGETAPQDGGTGGDTVKGPPDSTVKGNAPAPDSGAPAVQTASAVRAAMIIGAAQMQVERARELAGTRLIRRAQSCAECKEKIAMVPSSMVASALGIDQVREVIDGHTTEPQLVAGPGAGLANTLRTWGVDGEWPEKIGRLVEEHALRTLYDEIPAAFPANFASVVAKALR